MSANGYNMTFFHITCKTVNHNHHRTPGILLLKGHIKPDVKPDPVIHNEHAADSSVLFRSYQGFYVSDQQQDSVLNGKKQPFYRQAMMHTKRGGSVKTNRLRRQFCLF